MIFSTMALKVLAPGRFVKVIRKFITAASITA
jgi:hypothetical protein